MAATYIRCTKCGYEGESVHYFKMHPIEVLIAALFTAMLYFIINLVTNARACPQCGNHRALVKLARPPMRTAA
jgi:DNA-directed RNA polymerase subunit RPC12/RpoP